MSTLLRSYGRADACLEMGPYLVKGQFGHNRTYLVQRLIIGNADFGDDTFQTKLQRQVKALQQILSNWRPKCFGSYVFSRLARWSVTQSRQRKSKPR